eukprot:10472842-Karenia_brevis.AAC.1
MYVAELRTRLEQHHPRLCQMGHILIIILLYADDAALPADSVEDLQLAADIFVQFCNEMHLFVSVPKTKLMVFHASEDEGVKYQNGAVTADGVAVTIRIYDQAVEAVRQFTYLGVVVDETGNPKVHIDERLNKMRKAGHMLLHGLRRISGYSSPFMSYLWSTL